MSSQPDDGDQYFGYCRMIPHYATFYIPPYATAHLRTLSCIPASPPLKQFPKLTLVQRRPMTVG